jgi:hypothetical protein
MPTDRRGIDDHFRREVNILYADEAHTFVHKRVDNNAQKKLQDAQDALEYAEKQALQDRKIRWDLKQKVRERRRKAREQEALLKRQRKIGVVN